MMFHTLKLQQNICTDEEEKILHTVDTESLDLHVLVSPLLFQVSVGKK